MVSHPIRRVCVTESTLLNKWNFSIEGRLESDYNAFWKIGKERTPQYIVFRSDQILPKYLIRYRVSKQEMPQPNNGKWVLTNRENQQYNRGNHENPQYNPGTLPEWKYTVLNTL